MEATLAAIDLLWSVAAWLGGKIKSAAINGMTAESFDATSTRHGLALLHPLSGFGGLQPLARNLVSAGIETIPAIDRRDRSSSPGERSGNGAERAFIGQLKGEHS